MSQISTQDFVAPTIIRMPSGQDFVASTMKDNMDTWFIFPWNHTFPRGIPLWIILWFLEFQVEDKLTFELCIELRLDYGWYVGISSAQLILSCFTQNLIQLISCHFIQITSWVFSLSGGYLKYFFLCTPSFDAGGIHHVKIVPMSRKSCWFWRFSQKLT